MKEVTKEKVQKYTVYEALDGTEFHDKDECKRYEDTALCVLKSKIKNLIVTDEVDAWNLIGGYEDNSVFGVKVSTVEDADILKQWLLLEYPYLQEEEHIGRKEKEFNKIDSAIGDIYLLGINCDREWYVINSRQNIVDNLVNFGKKEENA